MADAANEADNNDEDNNTNEAGETTWTNQAANETNKTCVVNQAISADVTIEAHATN